VESFIKTTAPAEHEELIQFVEKLKSQLQSTLVARILD